MPPTPRPASDLAPTTLYRYGKHTKSTRQAHAEQSTAWRREQTLAQWPPERRMQLLRLISDGARVRAAAEEVGAVWQQVYGLAAVDDAFSAALDQATETGCICGGSGWRRDSSSRRRCDCPTARAYRAQEARQYRARQQRWVGQP